MTNYYTTIQPYCISKIYVRNLNTIVGISDIIRKEHVVTVYKSMAYVLASHLRYHNCGVSEWIFYNNSSNDYILSYRKSYSGRSNILITLNINSELIK